METIRTNKKLALNKETLRHLKVQTGLRTGGPQSLKPTCPSNGASEVGCPSEFC